MWYGNVSIYRILQGKDSAYVVQPTVVVTACGHSAMQALPKANGPKRKVSDRANWPSILRIHAPKRVYVGETQKSAINQHQ